MKTRNILDVIKARVAETAQSLEVARLAPGDRDLVVIARLEQKLESFKRIEAELLFIIDLEG